MERILTVGIRYRKTTAAEIERSMNELARLVETAGGRIVSSITQRRDRPDPAYLIGEGKALEIAGLAAEYDIRTIIFDEELSPAQQRNLEKLTSTKIIDRTRLILDIFASRARTREGIMQVELAQLDYFLPRLTKQGIHLDSQVGGIGTRGPGERKVEYDRREIRDRIARVKREIDGIRDQRELQKKKRIKQNIPMVGLIGYTNSGKSTLLNTLLDTKAVYADDKLFATLDSTVRKITLPSGRPVLFSDTVGFINKLPHQLIASFRSTLEGITDADCLVHLVDITSPDYRQHENTVSRTLDEIGPINVPLLKVYNKYDMLQKKIPGKKTVPGAASFISAKTGEGINTLLEKIDDILHRDMSRRDVFLAFDDSGLENIIRRHATIIKKSYNEKGMKLTLETDTAGWDKIKSLAGTKGIK